MDILFKHCAGLDVHKKIVVACVLLSGPEGVQRFVKQFGTTMAGLEALDAWLSGLGVTHVAMESTGVYWVRRESRVEDCSTRIRNLGRSLPFYR